MFSQSAQLEARISQVWITVVLFGVALVALLTQKGISIVSTQVVVSELLFNNCFMSSYLLVLKYIHFLYPDLSYACPLFKTEMKQS